VKTGPAARVALIATAILAVVYVAGVLIADLWIMPAKLTTRTDSRLTEHLISASEDPGMITGPATEGASPGGFDPDANTGPIYLWYQAEHSSGAPALPPALLTHPPASPVTVTLGQAGQFRLLAARSGNGWVVAGVSLAGDLHTEALVLDGELIAGPLLLLAMFGAALAVGVRALAPVEQARRRQLEFTADASHELRTPLSVITAEVDLALSAQRPAADYRDALTRVQSETGRLRRLVDDMLWLARFDSRPPPPASEPVDLGTLAAACADRWRAVGPAITVAVPDEPAPITAPPEWIDRLAGVLLDNACRYAGAGGQVRISVSTHGSRVSLVVEDSGPGIPEADRERLFDRFQRLEAGTGTGTGLGLAIGDSIVRSTGARWRVAGSALGGALMEVSWRSSHPRHLASHRASASALLSRPAAHMPVMSRSTRSSTELNGSLSATVR
jgi:signal transduction histidine kinase